MTTFSGKSADEVPHFNNADNQLIFCKYWNPPDSENQKGLILLVHGFGEHCARYDPVAKIFTDLGLVVFAHDHVGHGESEGYRAYITNYEIYLRDLLQHIDIMKQKYPDLPLYLYGHSLGGGLSILLAHRNPGLFKAVLLSSPFIEKPSIMKGSVSGFIIRSFNYLLPKLPGGYLDANLITRSAEQVAKYKSDPLVYHGAVRVGMGVQMSILSDEVVKSLPEITFPFIILHGEKDMLVEIEGSRQLVQQAKSSDKTLKEYKEALHELLHEIDDIPEQYLNEMQCWLKERM